jgi:hypothetical protein
MKVEMYDKEAYARKQFRQTVIGVVFADALAVCYLLYGLGERLFGIGAEVHSDLFSFILWAVIFSAPFLAFVWIIKQFVLAGIRQR